MSQAFLAACAYCTEHDLPLQPGGSMEPDENNMSSDMASFIAGWDANQLCKHPGCCCVCGHTGKCPEDGPCAVGGSFE